MPQPDDLESRVNALEGEVRELKGRVTRSEQDAAAARVLAGGADRDVNEMRTEIRDFRQATTASFNAMREDMLDLRRELNERFAAVDRGFAEIRSRLDGTAAGQQQIADMLAVLIEREGGPGPGR